LALLFTTRALAGAGVGAENVILDAYVTELMPRQVRGRSVALTHAVAFTAVPAAALLGRLLAPAANPHGWPLLLVIGSLGALLAWYFRRRLPESPRWLAQVGRTDEAAATLAGIEGAVERSIGRPLPPPDAMPSAPADRLTPFRRLWSPAYRGRTVMLIAFQLLQAVGYYGFMHWLPTLLQAKGFHHDTALTMQLGAFLLAPVGPLFGMWSCERWQRQRLIVALALALGVGHLAFGLAGGAVLLTVLAAAIVVGSNWFSAVFHAYQAELFPTEARATGIGFTYAWSRASMVALDVLMPGLIATRLPAAFGTTAGAFLGVAVIVGFFGPLTNTLALEEVSPDQVGRN
jgi:putative MFS transporter